MLQGGAGTYAPPNSGGGSAPASPQEETPLLFATSLLSVMRWPLSQSNIAAMVAWEAAEGGNWHNSARYNPLNTTEPEPGATSAGTSQSSIRAYVSWAQGLAATAATLSQNQRGYAGIRQAFASGNASATLPAALNASAWGTNGNTVASILSSGSWQKYELLTSPGGGVTGSGSSSSTTGCAFGIGPMCIFSQAGLNRFYGALLIGAGGLVITLSLGLVVIGALAETKAGRTASRAFGSAGLGAVVGAAAAPGRAVSGRRQQRQAEEEAATRRQATESHQAALRRAQLRAARARARRQEEGVRTQRAVTQGRNDSANIRDYERTEGAQRRREAVESRRAGRSVAGRNRRRIQQRQKFEDVFGEAE
ncbi:MAG: hypothetical protein M0T72_12065 [Candidatus Dormibacteraeota bacterium]|nr:hypothetical protein [Candidatus Dormibacteraeota bacterium]